MVLTQLSNFNTSIYFGYNIQLQLNKMNLSISEQKQPKNF